MVSPSEPRQRLNSWKVIAEYLGVSVRTAQKWETERRLPVQRPHGKRGLVSANPQELDEWRSLPEPTPVNPKPSRLPVFLSVGALSLAAATVATWWLLGSHGQPAAFRVDGKSLVVLDTAGKELFRATFESQLAMGFYSRNQEYSGRKRLWFGDLDADGHVETLFSYWPENSRETGTWLICFSDRGKEKWRFHPGRAVETISERFSPVYNVVHFLALPPDSRGRRRVAVTSAHHLYYPAQFALLDHSGRLLGEYWHSGILTWIEAADLDRDGDTEIYLGGTSNSYNQPELVVLDPSRLGGTSTEENPHYQLLGMPAASERARVLLPRTRVSRRNGFRDGVTQMWLERDGLALSSMEMQTPELSVFYHLKPDLTPREIVFSDSFKQYYAQAQASGRPDSTFSPELEAPVSEIRYLVRPTSRD